MARVLSMSSRFVLIGDTDEPSSCVSEHVVVNGDLSEAPKRELLGSPNFDQSVSSWWTSAVSSVKTLEGLS